MNDETDATEWENTKKTEVISKIVNLFKLRATFKGKEYTCKVCNCMMQTGISVKNALSHSSGGVYSNQNKIKMFILKQSEQSLNWLLEAFMGSCYEPLLIAHLTRQTFLEWISK